MMTSRIRSDRWWGNARAELLDLQECGTGLANVAAAVTQET